MYLTSQEKRMCAGEEGPGVQAAMELLVALGEAYDAPRLVRISSAHATGRTYKVGGDAKIQWMQELVNKGARFRTYTTLNPGGVDPQQWQKMGIPEQAVQNQNRSDRPFLELGAIPIGTCLPYMHGNAPRIGEHFSWGGSSGQIFANSVLGGRGSRDGAPAVIAAAVAGRTPEYGLHLEENRKGQVLVDTSQLDLEKMDRADYSGVGFYLGSTLVDKIPVFPSLPQDISQEELRALLSPMPTGGAITLCHVVGVTPEAPTLEAAFGGRKPQEKIALGPAEVRKCYEKLTTASKDTVDAVILGCPHCSYSFVKEVVMMLGGRKVNSGVRLWVSTSKQIKLILERVGLVDAIERAGGLVLADECIGVGTPLELIEGVRTVATCDARAAYFLPGSCNVGVLFGSAHDCIEAAIKGRWEA